MPITPDGYGKDAFDIKGGIEYFIFNYDCNQ